SRRNGAPTRGTASAASSPSARRCSAAVTTTRRSCSVASATPPNRSPPSGDDSAWRVVEDGAPLLASVGNLEESSERLVRARRSGRAGASTLPLAPRTLAFGWLSGLRLRPLLIPRPLAWPLPLLDLATALGVALLALALTLALALMRL